jgi:hypothetical protein
MADVKQIQDMAFEYQRAVTKALAVIDQLTTLKVYYVSYDLGNDAALPPEGDAAKGTSLEGRVDRAMFREIVFICDQIVAAVDGVPGRRAVLLNIVDGVPNE